MFQYIVTKDEYLVNFWSRLFPGYQISCSFPISFYIIHVVFEEFIIFFLLFMITVGSKFPLYLYLSSVSVFFTGSFIQIYPVMSQSIQISSQDFWLFANSILNEAKSAIPPLFNGLEVFSSASDKTSCLLKTFLRSLILMTQVSLYLFFPLELLWNCVIFL